MHDLIRELTPTYRYRIPLPACLVDDALLDSLLPPLLLLHLLLHLLLLRTPIATVGFLLLHVSHFLVFSSRSGIDFEFPSN